MPVFDDVGPALAQLRAAGWKLAILTNCDDDLIAETQTHIPAPFDMVVTAEQVGSYKPDLAHFHAFRARVGRGGGELGPRCLQLDARHPPGGAHRHPARVGRPRPLGSPARGRIRGRCPT